MVDPSGVLGFLFSLSKEWNNPNIIVISPISDIKNEPVHKEAVKDGHETRWVTEGKLRKRSRDGWRPLRERDKLGRPTIFMDVNRKLLMMSRKTED